MKDFFNYRVLIFSFLILTPTITNAQDSLIALAEKHNLNYPIDEVSTSKIKRFEAVLVVNELQTNSLIVMLRTNEKRLRELGILSRSSEITAKQRSGIEAKIAAMRAKNETVNNALINSFKESYGFSKVYFIYDTSLTSLKNGIKNGIFVNENGEVDKSIELTTANYYFCNFTLVSRSNESEGLVIYDANIERIAAPFPTVSVAGSSGLNMLMQILTSDNNYQKRAITKDVEKLQKNLDLLLEKGNLEFGKNQ
jgi:hypothetical protein